MSARRAGPLSEAAVAAFALGCAIGVGSGGRVLDILKGCRASLTQRAAAFRSSPEPLEGESAQTEGEGLGPAEWRGSGCRTPDWLASGGAPFDRRERGDFTSLSRLVAVTGTCYGPARKAIPTADLAMPCSRNSRC